MTFHRAMTFQILDSLIISNFLLGVIDIFGLLTPPSAPLGPSYALVMGGEPFFHDISMPLLDLEISLGLPSTFTRDIFPIDELPLISPTCVPLLELDAEEAEDDNNYDPSEHESEYVEDDSNHILESACSGLCGAGVGAYCGYR